MEEAVIVATARSPIGRAGKGSLVSLRPDALASQVVRAALDQVPELPTEEIDDLALGAWEHSGEQGGNIARRVAIRLGLDNVPGTSMNRACASSVQTTLYATAAIRSGFGKAYISAGVESVSRYSQQYVTGSAALEFHDPFFAAAEKRTAQLPNGGAPVWEDPRATGGVPDIYIGMGQTAENVAGLLGITRQEQDEFALRSQRLTEEAKAAGFYDRDITPVTLDDGTVISADDSPRSGTTLERLSELQPVFRPDGTVTAGNACPLNDGASALVVMSASRAKELGITPIARVVGVGLTALSPEIMGLGPVEATRKALANAKLTLSDIDYFEINEAFAAQVIPSYRQIGIDIDRLNVNGGAIALGHPFGSTGARITTTLLHTLQDRDATFGLETMCVGGGQGMAIIFERLN